jgi:hypothetical protein
MAAVMAGSERFLELVLRPVEVREPGDEHDERHDGRVREALPLRRQAVAS